MSSSLIYVDEMGERTEAFRMKAVECARAAELAAGRGDRERAATYLALARLWLNIADRDERLNRQRLKTGH
jgi:hypothetical protein